MFIITSQNQSRPDIKNTILYIILWAAGCMVAFAIVFLWNRGERRENFSVFNNLGKEVTNSRMSGEIVNELLLSANELNIYGSSSLIGYNAIDLNPDSALILNQIKDNPQNAYQKILRNKLYKLKQQQSSSNDFNVKPVPK